MFNIIKLLKIEKKYLIMFMFNSIKLLLLLKIMCGLIYVMESVVLI